MDNFELTDHYLSNRLDELDRKAFEQQLAGDPSLKAEVNLQKQIIEGVKQARAAQLKSMLNNVPVGVSMWTGTKLATAVVSAGLISSFLYFYLKGDNEIVSTNTNQQPQQEVVMAPDAIKEEKTVEETIPLKEDVSTSKLAKDEKKQISKTNTVTTPVRKPDIQVVDPSAELTEANEPKDLVNHENNTEISASRMQVITGISDKKHNFHYRFSEGKLRLYGPFDKSLYEILEIHGVSHAVFLFYKENYYLMNEDQSDITPLKLIKDAALLKKLKEYRGR